MPHGWRNVLPISFKYMKRVSVKFDPLDPSTNGTKEFLFQATNRKLQRTNPKCIIEHTLFTDFSPSFIEFEYKSGPVFKLLTTDRDVDQITYEMCLHTAHLENTTGMADSEIDEEEDDSDSQLKK